MRTAAFGLLLLFSFGCKGLGTVSCFPVDAECHPVPECLPQPPPCPPPPPPPCEPPKEKPKPRPAPAPAERSVEAAVTQDILLIPRTVYVPYAPQVPVAPARLGAMAPAERLTTRETEKPKAREPEQASRDAPAPCDKSAEALDKCCRILEQLDYRIHMLEQKQVPPAQIICPQPCPPPPQWRCP